MGGGEGEGVGGCHFGGLAAAVAGLCLCLVGWVRYWNDWVGGLIWLMDWIDEMVEVVSAG